jgi:Transcriptional regulators
LPAGGFIVAIFEQIERKSSRNRVYDQIRDAIFSGKLMPGERLTETKLSTDFDVSRVVIREALQQLAYDGLVVQNSYKGTNVVKLSSDEVNDLLSVRILLESEAVRSAKERLTESDKKMLAAMVKELDSIDDPFRHTALDFEFHQKLWELSGNQSLKRVLTYLTSPFFAMAVIVRQSRKFDPYLKKAKIGKHSKLIDALVRGSTDEAVHAIREHIEQNRKNIGESFDQFLETGQVT